MAYESASFPVSIWDGSTGNSWRASRVNTVNPDHEDWDRIVAEMIATQEFVFAGGAPHTHDASDIDAGTLDTARLGSGTADETTFLRGDQTWQSVAGGAHTHDASDIDSGTLDTARLGSGTADETTFLRGDQTWQPVAGGSGDGFTTIVSSADEDINNLDFGDHSEFQFAVLAGKRYMVDMLFWSSIGPTATGDNRVRFAISAGTMKGRGNLINLSLTNTAANLPIHAVNAITSSNLNVGAEPDFEFGYANRIAFCFTPSENATFKFQFGNSTPDNDDTSRIGKGSIMRWKQMN